MTVHIQAEGYVEANNKAKLLFKGRALKFNIDSIMEED
jgi:hypothetical protein